jgi:hypothetical protein
VSFTHRFWSSLNCHVRYHCCVVDGMFELTPRRGEAERLRPAAALTPDAVAAIVEKARVRVLRWFARGGLIEPGGRPRDARLGEQRFLCRCRCARGRTGLRRPEAAVVLCVLGYSMSGS